jgi:hypothetical protein
VIPDVFAFDPEAHRYTLNGTVIPGITSVLDKTGFVDKTWFTPESANRGRAVHAACQYLIEGALDWDSVHPDILPRVQAFGKFLDGVRPELILAEQPLYSTTWKFGGTPDLVLRIRGLNAIVDIKSGRSGLAAMLQTAAQSILVHERKGIACTLRYALELTAAGGFRVVQHVNPGDTTMFLNALAMIHRRVNEKELSI